MGKVYDFGKSKPTQNFLEFKALINDQKERIKKLNYKSE